MKNRKAIAVYLDNSDKMQTELSWLHKTWLLWSLEDEYDLVVFYNPSAIDRVKKFEKIRAIEMPYIRLGEIYKFLNSHYFCHEKEYSKYLLEYDYLIKTDCDVFLTERLLGYIPSKFLIGQGGYYKGDEVKKSNYIKNLAKKYNLTWRGMHLIGASYFGKAQDVIDITANQAVVTEKILQYETTDPDFKDSGFHNGIASMLAGELVINHCLTNQHVILHALDTKCWEMTKIGSDVLHIHAWHTDQKWSKHAFYNKQYDEWVVKLEEAFISAANYCQFIATISYEEMYKIKNLYKNGKLKPNYGLQNHRKDLSKFSVIIPTMWKSDRTLKLLKDLNDCDLVDEIILIDNYLLKRPKFEFSKVRILEQIENIFVNPAWNLGVKSAKNELICICNDDINFEVDSTFDFIFKNREVLGCVGVHPDSYTKDTDDYVLQSGYHTGGGGWGCLMFCKKENWIEIPDNIKIGYGDDWLAITNKPHFSLIHKNKIETEMSTTSSRKEFNPIVSSDIRNWKKIFSR